jgi:hypothetical protein
MVNYYHGKVFDIMNDCKSYVFLTDEGIIQDGYDEYYIISPNYVNTIQACRETGVKYIIIEDCWTTVEDVRRDKEYLERVKEKILKYVTVLLNEYHHSDYSASEWGILVNRWLESYLAILWEKYNRILFFDKKMLFVKIKGLVT